MSPRRLPVILTLCLVLAFTLGTLDLAPTQATVAPVALPVPSAERAAEASGDGLLFIENAGQFDPAARFQVWGGGQTLWLAEDALWLTIVEPGDRSQGSGDREQGAERFSVAPAEQGAARGSVPQKAVNLRVSFPGANPQPVLEPFDRLDTHVSYFIGNDPAKWRADVPVWGGVRYRGPVPGVDLDRRGRACPCAVDGWATARVAPTMAPGGAQGRGPGCGAAARRGRGRGGGGRGRPAPEHRRRRSHPAAAGGGPSERATCQRGTCSTRRPST